MPLSSRKYPAPVRTICCEGLCSKAYALDDIFVGRLRAAGYAPESVRAWITDRLVATNHAESRRVINEQSQTVVVYYRCMKCGHERQFGVEEL